MKPFLKWAGNKYRILNHILERLPSGQRLVEPFVGSGAVFLNTNYQRYLLGEYNPDLINLYRVLQAEGPRFIRYCQGLFAQENNQEHRYYELRQRFNQSRRVRERSALFLYLNKHGYNGLCRYNKQGGYNVPFGSHKKPYFPELEMQYFHKKSQAADLHLGDFSETLAKACKQDVVYCDPPYVPLSATANFTNYTKDSFKESQQIQLAQEAKRLADRGIPVIISNHDTEFTRHHYKDAELHHFKVQRNISRDGLLRTKVPELIALFF